MLPENVDRYISKEEATRVIVGIMGFSLRLTLETSRDLFKKSWADLLIPSDPFRRSMRTWNPSLMNWARYTGDGFHPSSYPTSWQSRPVFIIIICPILSYISTAGRLRSFDPPTEWQPSSSSTLSLASRSDVFLFLFFMLQHSIKEGKRLNISNSW